MNDAKHNPFQYHRDMVFHLMKLMAYYSYLPQISVLVWVFPEQKGSVIHRMRNKFGEVV